MNSKEAEHFKGKKPLEHLKEARQRGAKATAEIHGTETPGSFSAACDSAKETAIILLGIWIVLTPFSLSKSTIIIILILFSCGWFLWKIGRSALLGWARLERLHRLIEQERWEIEHHRSQEKEELIAMYSQKGMSGKLLDEVVEVLMADDNRLLWVMLEEELGLTLETYEHPLKQATGAGIGVLISLGLGTFALYLGSFLGLMIAMSIVIASSAIVDAKCEGNNWIKSLVWNGALAALSVGSIHLLATWLHHYVR